VQITEDRRKHVIDLYFNQHKTYSEIAQIERISPHDIHAIIKEEHKQKSKRRATYYRFKKSRRAVIGV